jgi:hypothetical protein
VKNQTYLLLVMTLVLMTLTAGCGTVVGQAIGAVTPLPPANTAPGNLPVPATVAPLPPGAAQPSPSVAEAVVADVAAATPTPLSIVLPAGGAAAIALATDVAMKPEIDAPLQFDEQPVRITFDEFYAGFDMRKGLAMSDKLMSLDGVDVVMEGYMAPPLKPELDWFVLTRIRLEFCPFCSSGADWPMDIAVVYIQEGTMVATQAPVRISGRMEIGTAVDPETGMVSLVRIYADKVEMLRS